jgi:hypothetical protein
MECYRQQGIGFTPDCVTLNGVNEGSAFTVLSNGRYDPLNTTYANIWGRGSWDPCRFNISTRRGVSRHSSVGVATRYGLKGPGFESRWRARFSAPVYTDPGAHSASNMGGGKAWCLPPIEFGNRLKKGWRYNSTPPMDIHGLLQRDLYL